MAELATAIQALRNGRLVVYPTDTLLGLGARATSKPAVAQLERLKRRPPGQPMSVLVSSVPEIDRWAELSDPARAWIRMNLPGPYTILAHASVESKRRFASSILGPKRVVGIRVPDHPVARALAHSVGPITATSANRHGDPPARTIAQARLVFGREVSVYLSGLPAPSGRPSTLVDLTKDIPELTVRS